MVYEYSNHLNILMYTLRLQIKWIIKHFEMNTYINKHDLKGS